MMLPFDNRFGIVYPQISYVIVKQMAGILSPPADQLGLFKICYESFIRLHVHCGAPLFVCFQVNQPYFFINPVQHHNLLRTDHLDINIHQIFTFHLLPE